jgi:hypothetical protein
VLTENGHWLRVNGRIEFINRYNELIYLQEAGGICFEWANFYSWRAEGTKQKDVNILCLNLCER